MRKTVLAGLLLALALPLARAEDADDETAHRQMLGWIEWLVLEPAGIRVKAKLDTGAKTASLHGENIEPFERDGEEWVRFDIPIAKVRDVEKTDDAPQFRGLRIERPVSRDVLIKRQNAEPQRRFVVALPFCINGREHTAEFSLTDRGNFNYPVLLGRRFMAGVIVVDPAETFIAGEACDYHELEDFEARRLLITGEAVVAEPLEGEGEDDEDQEENGDGDAGDDRDEGDGEG